jgi:hypothetical protein
MNRQVAIRQINDKLERLDSETLEGLRVLVARLEPQLTAAGVPYTGDPETDAVLNEHPDILERLERLEHGQERTIPVEEVAAKYGIKL